MTQLTTRIKLNSPQLNVMGMAALKAGRKLVRDFNEVEHLQISRKGPGNFVSVADHRAEKIIREELHKARPEYGFLLEESGEVIGKNPRFRWIVDPLDGTNNFLHGLPHFAVSIALEHDKEIIAGVIYDPIKDEMFYAEKGLGAYVNERRLRVSARDRLSSALLGLSLTYNAQIATYTHAPILQKYQNLSTQVAGLRRMGSAALDLAYIACGRLDGYLGLDLSPWDVAAGLLIVKEAGGYATTIVGQSDIFETRTILAANDRLHRHLLNYLNGTVKTV
jgi:myo-inositol-1(or 4)-monophosphatase